MKYKFFKDANKKKEAYEPEDIRKGFLGSEDEEKEEDKKDKESSFSKIYKMLIGKSKDK